MFFRRLRKFIASKQLCYELSGEVELTLAGYAKASEAGFRWQNSRVRLLKRSEKIYTAIIPNAKTETLLPIIKQKVQPDSVVYTDTFNSYNAPYVSDFHHRRINHSTLFAKERNHINGIENFWNQAKRHLRRFNGIKPESFYWYLKECEWRFNGESHKTLLNQLKHWVKYSSN